MTLLTRALVEVEQKMEGQSEAKSPTSVQQKIEDVISCPVCLEVCREPRALPCYHVFCLPCLESAAKRLRPGEPLQCPQCRRPVEVPKAGVSGLQVAFHVNSLIEIYESIQEAARSPGAAASGAATSSSPQAGPWCANCTGSTPAGFFCAQCNQFLCAECRGVHGKWAQFAGHALSAIGGDGEEPPERGAATCKSHPPHPLSHYCKRCRQLICSECLHTKSGCSHAHHKVSIAEAAHLARDAILASLEPVRGQLATIEGIVKRIGAKKRHISEQATDVNSAIDKDFEALSVALERRRSELKQAVKQEEEQKHSGLSAQEQQVDIARLQLSNYLEGINHCLGRGSSVQVIRMQGAVEEKVKEILREFGSLPQSPVEAANLCYSGSDRELASSVSSLGVACSSSATAADFSLFAEGCQWATACDEASITVTYIGSELATNLFIHLKIELSSVDGGNTALFETPREIHSNRVVIHYIPIAKGKRKLHVTLFGSEVSNSPLDLKVMGPFRFTGTLIRSVSDLRRPWGVAVSSTGQLAVVDNQGWHALHVYRSASSSSPRSFGSVAIIQTPEILIGEEVCNEPRGVAFTADGNIVLVDGKRHRVLRYSQDGKLLFKAGCLGKGPLQFNDPVGVAVNPSGQILVCDRRNHRIQVLSPNLVYLRQIGRFGEGDQGPGLYLPWDVACDSEGCVYVADCGNCCVKVFSSDGKFLMKIGGQGKRRGEFEHVSAICIDANDYLYAVDMERACVSVFNPRGDLKMEFGTFGQLLGQFYKPRGIAVDRDGCVYVSDLETSPLKIHVLTVGDGRVQVFQ